jgi:hypothetical protein
MLGKFGIATAFLLVTVAPSVAQSSCVNPIAPAAVDGGNATTAQMKAAHDDVMNFIKSSDDYQDCVDAELKDQERQATNDKKPVDPQLAKDASDKMTANQRMKEKVGAEYNAAVQAYKAKHPG